MLVYVSLLNSGEYIITPEVQTCVFAVLLFVESDLNMEPRLMLAHLRIHTFRNEFWSSDLNKLTR